MLLLDIRWLQATEMVRGLVQTHVPVPCRRMGLLVS